MLSVVKMSVVAPILKSLSLFHKVEAKKFSSSLQTKNCSKLLHFFKKNLFAALLKLEEPLFYIAVINSV
jgi:hypothetical protein